MTFLWSNLLPFSWKPVDLIWKIAQSLWREGFSFLFVKHSSQVLFEFQQTANYYFFILMVFVEAGIIITSQGYSGQPCILNYSA